MAIGMWAVFEEPKQRLPVYKLLQQIKVNIVVWIRDRGREYIGFKNWTVSEGIGMNITPPKTSEQNRISNELKQ
jgi:hypothetical protein